MRLKCFVFVNYDTQEFHVVSFQTKALIEMDAWESNLLSIITFNLCDLNHLKNFLVKMSRVLDMELTDNFLEVQLRVLSSTNNVNLNEFELLGKQLMEMRNKRGASIEHLQTLQSTVRHSEVQPSSDTNYVIFFEQDWSQLNVTL